MLAKWDYKKHSNPNILNVVAREEDRIVWKTYRMEKAVYNLGRIHMTRPVPNPTPPDELDEPLEEPDDLEEFLAEIRISFQSASASFFEDLKSFRGVPREPLIRLTDRFDEVAEPLLAAGLMTTRGLALNLRAHIPAHLRKATLEAMMRQDMIRYKKGLPMTDKDELLRLAQDAESFLLEFETEMRAAGLTPDERHTDSGQPAPPPHKPTHRPMEERLGGGNRDVRERLGPRVPPTQDTRECNHCKQIGHIARLCPDLPPHTSSTSLYSPDGEHEGRWVGSS